MIVAVYDLSLLTLLKYEILKFHMADGRHVEKRLIAISRLQPSTDSIKFGTVTHIDSLDYRQQALHLKLYT